MHPEGTGSRGNEIVPRSGRPRTTAKPSGLLARALEAIPLSLAAALLLAVLAWSPALAETKKLDLGEPANADWRRAMRLDKSQPQGRSQSKAWSASGNTTQFKPDSAPSAADQAKPRALLMDEEQERAKAKPQVGVSVPF